jgi:hypothetical protein
MWVVGDPVVQHLVTPSFSILIAILHCHFLHDGNLRT